MSYISNNLANDEKILIKENVNKWLYEPFSLALGFLSILMLIVGITEKEGDSAQSIICISSLMLCFSIYHFYSNKLEEMVITNKRVILKKGIFIHETNEILLEKIESVSIVKSFWGILFGYGDINFTGTGGKKVKFSGINNPQETKNKIDSIIETYKSSPKNYQETSTSRLEKLFELKEKGAITQEEYDKEKTKILKE